MRGWSYLLLAGVWLTQHSLTVKPAAAQPKRKGGKKLAMNDAHKAEKPGVRFERRAWRQARSQASDRFAQVRSGPTGERVVVDGSPLYPREGGTRIVSNLVWSQDGKGLAFVERATNGILRLLVFPLLQMDEPLTWDLPDSVLSREPRVSWVGPTQVGVGDSEAVPQIIARFTIERQSR
jgi:hypothetical protein